MVLLVLGAVLLLLALIAFVAVVGARSYNALNAGRQDVAEAWSSIDVQLTKRHDLIGQLVEVVQGYSGFERDALTDITERRAAAARAVLPDQQGVADLELGHSMGQLVARAEDYPDLKADESYRRLGQELTTLEDDIASARRYYNGHVKRYNTTRETIPHRLIAGSIGFQPSVYYQIDDDERGVVRHVFAEDA